ncbi:hypothetical protein FPV67DRAFT_1501046 [Lyophyllum atratum]|nr:hypothetical protein FPV67DRAFT_1501046 [Lyophyllum atratum]
MTIFNVSALNGSPDLSEYTLSLSQSRIMASSCPTSVLQYSPDTTHAEENTVKAKKERNTTGGGWFAFSVSPSLRVGGTVGRTEGIEKGRRRWQIIVRQLSAAERTADGGAYSKGMVWQYAYSGDDRVFKRVTEEGFEHKPTAVFGFKEVPNHSAPLLDVSLVVCWSLGATKDGRYTSRPSLLRREKRKNDAGKEIPAFINLLHYVSMVVDLAKVGPGKSWIVDADAEDERTSQTLAEARGPIILKPLYGTLSNTLTSESEITVRQAVEGRIAGLTQAERAGEFESTIL